MSQWRNLIFEGGGVKGLAYAGALKVLEKEGVLKKIKRAGGSSAGGITASLLAIKLNPKKIQQIMDETDFNRFMDDDWGVVRDTHRLLNEFGWHKGEAFKKWFRKILRNQGFRDDITFAELKKSKKSRDLYMTGTNINYMDTKIFSHEHTPDVPIVDALRITMSFPFFFKAVIHKDDVGGESDPPGRFVFMDGGLLRNYPINLFDNKTYIEKKERAKASMAAPYVTEDEQNSGYVYNCQTLGLRIDSAKEIKAYEGGGVSPHQDVEGFLSYTFALVNTLTEASNRAHLNKNDWHRTLFIENPDVGAMDFTLSREKKIALIRNGKKGAEKYFEWFNNPKAKDRPINKYILANPR